MKIASHFARMIAPLRSWLRASFHRSRLESEMEAELTQHIASRTEDLIRSGYAPQNAARQARIELGPALKHKEEMRASLGLRFFDELGADLRYAVRMLRKSPVFTLIAAGSLALAIGANTAIFSVAKQLLYDRLDVPHAAELRLLSWTGSQDHVAVHHIHGDYDTLPGGRMTSTSFSYPVYQQLRKGNAVLGDLFAFREMGMNATIRDQAQRVRAALVSGNYYAQLGIQPQIGRVIQPSDDNVPGQSMVAVISDGLWTREFARSPAVLGQWIRLNDVAFVIVGVNPRSFTGTQDAQQTPDVFVPLSSQPLVDPQTVRGAQMASNHTAYGDLLQEPEYWWINIMGRARPAVSDAAAQATLDGQLSAIVRATMPVRPGEDLPRMWLRDGSRGQGMFAQGQLFAKPMAVLMTLVGLVLLLACANVANLLLARGAQRQREMSVRLALGAGRARVLRQMLVESLLLAALGGAGGVVAGYLGSIAIPKLTENAWERSDFHVHFDWMVFAFTAGITILTGLLFGMAPALAAARSEMTHGLKDVSQTTTRRRKGMNSKALVGFQVALSTLLVIGAGLFLRTLAGLNAIDAGFRTDHLLLVQVNPPGSKYPAGKDVLLHERIEQAFAAVPGVESASATGQSYVSDDDSMTDFLPEGEVLDKNKHQEEDYNIGGDRFFETLGIPIVAGRGFGPQDTSASVKVAVINQALAKKRFPGQNPVGKRFRTDAHDVDGRAAGDNWYQIVGVCGNVRYSNLRDDPPPQFILNYMQQPDVGGMVYQIRTHSKPEAMIPALRRVLQQIDPTLPLVNVRTQQQQIDADLQQERLFVTLTSGFGVLALLLASVGIYGIMAYTVAQRTSEIGIRLALGALPQQIRGMVLRESTGLAVVGVVAGLAVALSLTHLVKSMLYGIAPYDPLTLGCAVLLLLVVALAASWIPARRAASVEPMEALRHE